MNGAISPGEPKLVPNPPPEPCSSKPPIDSGFLVNTAQPVNNPPGPAEVVKPATGVVSVVVVGDI